MQRSQTSHYRIDLYNYKHRIDLIFKQMQAEFSAYNLDVARKYDRVMVAEGIGLGARQLHLNRILSLTRKLKKDWNQATKEDIDNLIFEIMDRYSDAGRETEYTYDHKKVLKIFFRWLKFGNRNYNYCLKKFRQADPAETEDIVMKKPQSKLKGGDLISDTERTWLLDAAESSRDKALIDVPLDGGIRPGELLTLQIKNVKQDPYGFIIFVEGKTGIRPVRMIRCTPTLARWLEEHPFRENPEAPLWINFEPRRYGNALSYAGARMIVARICEKVQEKHPNFNKRVFLNLFRHTEATYSAKFMRDGITKKRHGWSKNSRMPGRYEHLVNDDVEEVIFDHFGIKKADSKALELPITCVACSRINPANGKLCSQCGKALTLEAAIERDEAAQQKVDETQQRLSRIESQLEKLIQDKTESDR